MLHVYPFNGKVVQVYVRSISHTDLSQSGYEDSLNGASILNFEILTHFPLTIKCI